MKFLIDAQLPYRLKLWLVENDYDAIHTDDLPERNLSADLTIADHADTKTESLSAKTAIFSNSAFCRADRRNS
jgi:predicted nuclease of predicted toxin-antitoxin system